MRRSKLFTKTLKEAPADEVAHNAQLLTRAGFVHKEMAGVYTYLPLGWRVIEKIKQIVREEMNKTGSQEMMLTVLQPRELWEKTNRWDDAVVDNWFKTKLANGTELGVGLTHEEPVVDAVRPYISSYKDLPMSVYQIASKFRNEKRAKSGLLRGREFIMKDAYTLAKNQTEHEELYEQLAEAYKQVYVRLGLGDITYRTKADGGYFTDRYSDEYQTRSDIGEDTVFHAPGTDLYFNAEVAPSLAPVTDQSDVQEPMLEQETPGIVGVEQLSKVLGVPITQTVKTMLYVVDDSLTAVAVRGDYAVNEIKLRKALSATSIALADEATVKHVTGAEIGYAGLIGLPSDVKVVADDSIEHLVNFELGANRTNYHNVNVNWDRDVKKPENFYDIKEAKEGDLYPETKQVYETFSSVEVGNIFSLEAKYTNALDVYYTDDNGDRQEIIMGCYGIGVSRLMGVIAEHFADEKGLVWPHNIAPFMVYLVSIGEKGSVEADKVYDELTARGVEVLYDDRDARPGEKFADAELMGIPYRLTISDRGVEAGKFELTNRKTGETTELTRDELLAKLG